jgi:hypothetical protein
VFIINERPQRSSNYFLVFRKNERYTVCMRKQNYTPAEWIVKQFGGIRQTAAIVGRAPSAVSAWKQRGRVPSALQADVLELAKKMRLDVTAEDLVRGR